jgi:hypothetical protein
MGAFLAGLRLDCGAGVREAEDGKKIALFADGVASFKGDHGVVAVVHRVIGRVGAQDTRAGGQLAGQPAGWLVAANGQSRLP